MPRTMSVGIFGLGLIGTSCGLDLMERGQLVTGYDLSPAHGATALRLGAVGRLVDEPSGRYDVLVLAAPPRANAALLHSPAHADLWLDTSSVKGPIVREAQALSLPFVGGHPLAGAAEGGPKASRAGLFRDRTFFLCPAGGPLDLATEIVRSLEARPVIIDVDEHDRAVAASSHLVYLVSVALSLTLADMPVSQVGPAGREMLRTATSPPDLWREILDLNRGHVRDAASRLARNLEQLAAGDLGRLEAARKAARQIREEGSGGR